MIGRVEEGDAATSPGIVVLGSEGEVIRRNEAAAAWLEEFKVEGTSGLPIELHAVAGALKRAGPETAGAPRLSVRTRSGRWATLHASWLGSDDGAATAVIIEQASPLEVAPTIMAAYGLSRREREITGLVCRGLSTKEISRTLEITTNTVQDHLKSVFEKTGVRSRRELVVAVLRHDYLPAMRGRRLIPAGAVEAQGDRRNSPEPAAGQSSPSVNEQTPIFRAFPQALHRTRTDDPFLTMEVLYQLS